jgi:predicted unusual protein kinase regulating ubiquinone biosynthesis (AarF/ABC1/UbiB family)
MVGSVGVTAWNPVRRLQEAPALRFGYAMSMAGRTLAGYRLLKLRYRRPEQRVAYRAATHAYHVRSAERIYDAALRMQGLMIKVGQTIGSNPTAMPAEYITVLSRLQDAVPARPWNVARPAIEQELGRPIEEVFASIDRT